MTLFGVSQARDFSHEKLTEQMDKSVMEAKNEIEAFTQYKLNALGLEKLEELKALPEKNENV